jgi:hypothetical protein
VKIKTAIKIFVDENEFDFSGATPSGGGAFKRLSLSGYSMKSITPV